MNGQHDPAVEQAAPHAAEPRHEAMFGFVPVLRGLEVSHPFYPCVQIIEHFNGQFARLAEQAAVSRLPRSPEWRV